MNSAVSVMSVVSHDNIHMFASNLYVSCPRNSQFLTGFEWHYGKQLMHYWHTINYQVSVCLIYSCDFIIKHICMHNYVFQTVYEFTLARMWNERFITVRKCWVDCCKLMVSHNFLKLYLAIRLCCQSRTQSTLSVFHVMDTTQIINTKLFLSNKETKDSPTFHLTDTVFQLKAPNCDSDSEACTK